MGLLSYAPRRRRSRRNIGPFGRQEMLAPRTPIDILVREFLQRIAVLKSSSDRRRAKSYPSNGPVDSGVKRNGLSEADFHVFAKLGENGLERGLEAEAFSRGQVCGEDDFLNVLVGELIDIELTRQPLPLTPCNGKPSARGGGGRYVA